MTASGTPFSPVVPRKTCTVGPNANRGQKSGPVGGFALGIDYLTLIFAVDALDAVGQTNMRFLLSFLFGGESLLKWSGWSGRAYQFYSDSSCVFDREGALVGRIAVGGNGDTMLVELSGAGCRWVKDWSYVHDQAALLGARISRCDVALDDFDGRLFGVRAVADAACAGAFAGSGRPPKSRFLDDHGHATGCTLYVGRKGHKELCVYEKGRQLGDEGSAWVRAEVRLYGKHYGSDESASGVRRTLPLDILLHPARYFRGAYEYLAVMTADLALCVGASLRVVRARVEATAVAAVKWFREQCGPMLNLFRESLGDDFADFARARLERPSMPGRFRGLGASTDIHNLLRSELCKSM